MNNLKIYLKAIGANRYAGGSHNWLRIRELTKTKNCYTLKVKTRFGIRYIDCDKDMITPNLIFKNNNHCINFKDVVNLMDLVKGL